jgi:hypothetical protein
MYTDTINTYLLGQVRICCSEHPDGCWVVTECVELVSTKVESFWFACWSWDSGVRMLVPSTSANLTTLLTLSLVFELFGPKCRACICLESANGIPERFCDVIHPLKSFVDVHL